MKTLNGRLLVTVVVAAAWRAPRLRVDPFSIDPAARVQCTFVGSSSTAPIKLFVIEGQSTSGIGFDDLIYEPLPLCDLQLSHGSGNLTLQFDLLLEAPATWNVWLNAP